MVLDESSVIGMENLTTDFGVTTSLATGKFDVPPKTIGTTSLCFKKFSVSQYLIQSARNGNKE